MTKFLSLVWKKITKTKALEEASGKYETDFFEPVYRILYSAGLSLYDRGLFYLAYSYSISFMIIVFLASDLWYLLSMFSSLDKVIDSIISVPILINAMFRYKIMVDNKDIFKSLAMSMESPYFDISTKQRKVILEYWISTNEKYLKLLLTLGMCTLTAWNVYPLVDDLEYNLVVTMRLPYDYASPSLYPVTYVLTSIIFNVSCFYVMVNDLVLQSHLIHLLCQFVILADCFENILKDCEEDFEDLNANQLHLNAAFTTKYTERFGFLVEQHKFILKISMDLRRILSLPMLGQMACSSLLICFAAYGVTATVSAADTSKFLMSLLYLGYNLFQLFLFCRWCDEIKMQSENIRQAVYFSGWERMSMVPGVRTRIMLVVARAGRPLVLTAGGVYDLSLISYAAIVKGSYSALSILLQARHD